MITLNAIGDKTTPTLKREIKMTVGELRALIEPLTDEARIEAFNIDSAKDQIVFDGALVMQDGEIIVRLFIGAR